MYTNRVIVITGVIFIVSRTVLPISVTEQSNSLSQNLHAMSALEIVSLMNAEDQKVPVAISSCLSEIARAAETIAARLKAGGRLIYVGAGSSGRLGVLDASETIPTFSADPGQIVGIIAGGDKALRFPIEGVEDDARLGIADLQSHAVTKNDVVCGISASGSAAYVSGALHYAKEVGCFTVMITCNTKQETKHIDCFIAAEVGPEILTGSTRLKAGSATKMILNMLTTTTFVLLGKVYKNFMIDVKPLNQKLVARQKRILRTLLPGLNEQEVADLLQRSEGNIKAALLMQLHALDYAGACAVLQQVDGNILMALEECANYNLVDIGSLGSNIVVQSRFATTDNFVHEALYLKFGGNVAKCYLLQDAAFKLCQAANEFESLGYRIKVWDGYRPRQVQEFFWEKIHDDRYIANPVRGSRHNRGAAVDLTLIDTEGKELDMGTAYCDFTEKAHSTCKDLPAEVIINRQILASVMAKYNFHQLDTEWWHFDLNGWEKYPLLQYVTFGELFSCF